MSCGSDEGDLDQTREDSNDTNSTFESDDEMEEEMSLDFKREHHNNLERGRRVMLSSCFDYLQAVVPPLPKTKDLSRRKIVEVSSKFIRSRKLDLVELESLIEKAEKRIEKKKELLHMLKKDKDDKSVRRETFQTYMNMHHAKMNATPKVKIITNRFPGLRNSVYEGTIETVKRLTDELQNFKSPDD